MENIAAVFDMDGTLVNSEKKIRLDVAEAMKSLGVRISPEEIAGNWYDLAQRYGIDNEVFDREFEKRKSWEDSLRDGEVSLFSDTLNCLDTLQDHGITLAILTRSNPEYTHAKINYFGLERYFKDRVAITPVKSKGENMLKRGN